MGISGRKALGGSWQEERCQVSFPLCFLPGLREAGSFLSIFCQGAGSQNTMSPLLVGGQWQHPFDSQSARYLCPQDAACMLFLNLPQGHVYFILKFMSMCECTWMSLSLSHTHVHTYPFDLSPGTAIYSLASAKVS